MLLAGTALLAVGVQNFLEPMELVAGGISGLGMILDDVSRRLGGPAVPLWLVNTALNVPLFLLAWYAQGRQFLGKTILTSLLFSVMLYIAARFPMYHGDLLTAAAYGGVLMGAGLGKTFPLTIGIKTPVCLCTAYRKNGNEKWLFIQPEQFPKGGCFFCVLFSFPSA